MIRVNHTRVSMLVLYIRKQNNYFKMLYEIVFEKAIGNNCFFEYCDEEMEREREREI